MILLWSQRRDDTDNRIGRANAQLMSNGSDIRTW